METERLKLRRFADTDFTDFSKLIRDKMADPLSIYDDPFPTDDDGLHAALTYFSGSDEFFAMEKKDTREVIGFICVNRAGEQTRNLGYCVRTDMRKNGYAWEAVREMIRYAREALKARTLISGTAEKNIPSVNLLKKAGFTLTDKSEVSFVHDENGNPIQFTGCAFERALYYQHKQE